MAQRSTKLPWCTKLKCAIFVLSFLASFGVVWVSWTSKSPQLTSAEKNALLVEANRAVEAVMVAEGLGPAARGSIPAAGGDPNNKNFNIRPFRRRTPSSSKKPSHQTQEEHRDAPPATTSGITGPLVCSGPTSKAKQPLLVALAATDTNDQVQGVLVVVRSALAHASNPRFLKFRVVTYASGARQLLAKLRGHTPPDTDIDVAPFDAWTKRVSKMLGRTESYSGRQDLFEELNFAAFYLHEIFAHESRVLYLDTDTVVMSDLVCELAEGRLDLGGKPAAGAKDCSQQMRKYVNFNALGKLHIESRLPARMTAKGNACVINRGVVLIDTARWASANITERIEILVRVHLSKDGPLWRSGVSQPPFLLAIHGYYWDLGVQWNVRGLGRKNLSPDEIAAYKKQGVWSSYFDGFQFKCKYHCKKGEEGYSLTPHVSPYAATAKVLHFNGELKPGKSGRVSDRPLTPPSRDLPSQDRAAAELRPLCSCGKQCVQECAGIWWRYVPELDP